MRKVKALTILQVADKLNVHPGTVERWCIEGKLKAQNIEGKLYIDEHNLRYFLFNRKDTAKAFLELFSVFKEFEGIFGEVMDYFGDEPGCVIALPPGGVPYALSLYFSFPPDKDIDFFSLGDEPYDPDLIKGRKILLVDDSTRSGKSFEIVKKELESIEKLDIKDIIIAVYDDFAGCADFAVRRIKYEEHSKSLMRTLEQFKL